MVNLNGDVVRLILDHCHAWPSDLGRLARVSSLWTAPAQRRLFDSPCLQTFEACDLLARTIETSPALRYMIHSLDLRPRIREGHSWESTTWSLSEVVMRLLATTRLESLTLAGELSFSAEFFLHVIEHPQRLRRLRIEGDVTLDYHWQSDLEGSQASLEWDSKLAMRFFGLRSLTIVGPLSLNILETDFVEDDSVESSVVGWHLEELHLFDVELTEMSDAIRSLLPSASAWRNLRMLSVTVEQLSDIQTFNFTSLMPLVSTTLETLVVRSLSESFSTVALFEKRLQSAHILFPLSNIRSPELANVAVYLEGEDLDGDILESDVDETAYLILRLDALLEVIIEQRFLRLSRLVVRGSCCSRESIAHKPEGVVTLTKLCEQRKLIFRCLSKLPHGFS